MREIRFRAWDKNEEEMIPWWVLRREYWNQEHETVADPDGHGNHRDMFNAPELEVMQFACLRDKNGREIYEGDVVIIPNGYPFYCDGLLNYVGEVVWCDVNLAWAYDLHVVSDRVVGRACGDLLSTEDGWEVIGNIHENPELINK